MNGWEGGGLSSDLGAMLLLAVGIFAVLGLWPRRTEQEKGDDRYARARRRRDRERVRALRAGVQLVDAEEAQR